MNGCYLHMLMLFLLLCLLSFLANKIVRFNKVSFLLTGSSGTLNHERQ